MKTKLNPAGEIGPDAALLALIKRLRALQQKWAAALDAISAAEERTVHPERPEALCWRKGDSILPICPVHGGARYFNAESVEMARDFLRSRPAHSKFWRSGVAPRVRERLREIVAAHDSWLRADLKARRDSGEIAAGRATDRIGARRAALYAEIGRTPARTAAGIVAKVSAAAYDVDIFRNDFREGHEIEHVLASATLDAVEMIGDSAIGFAGKPAAEFVAELRAYRRGRLAVSGLPPRSFRATPMRVCANEVRRKEAVERAASFGRGVLGAVK